MSHLSSSELIEQIEKIKRRLFGHGIRYELPMEKQAFVKNSNPDRLFRLLMRKAKLERDLTDRHGKGE